jgi:hypothetical protein
MPIDNQVLIPPSPPHIEDSSKASGTRYSKTKGKALARKPAANFPIDEDHSGDEMLGTTFKLASRDRAWHKTIGEEDMPVDRPVLSTTTQDQLQESIHVDIRDDLMPVLELSSGGREGDSEDKVVLELMYGRRERHYYPRHGGEVWDAGDEGSNDDSEGDWETLPVPWEVAEM